MIKKFDGIFTQIFKKISKVYLRKSMENRFFKYCGPGSGPSQSPVVRVEMFSSSHIFSIFHSIAGACTSNRHNPNCFCPTFMFLPMFYTAVNKIKAEKKESSIEVREKEPKNVTSWNCRVYFYSQHSRSPPLGIAENISTY